MYNCKEVAKLDFQFLLKQMTELNKICADHYLRNVDCINFRLQQFTRARFIQINRDVSNRPHQSINQLQGICNFTELIIKASQFANNIIV